MKRNQEITDMQSTKFLIFIEMFKLKFKSTRSYIFLLGLTVALLAGVYPYIFHWNKFEIITTDYYPHQTLDWQHHLVKGAGTDERKIKFIKEWVANRIGNYSPLITKKSLKRISLIFSNYDWKLTPKYAFYENEFEGRSNELEICKVEITIEDIFFNCTSNVETVPMEK